MAASYETLFSTRDLTTLSNLAAVPAAIFVASSGRWGFAFVQLLACVLSIVFHATEADTIDLLGVPVPIEHGLDDGVVVPSLVPSTWLEAGRQHSVTLLRLDELGAIFSVIATMVACGGPVRTLRAAFGPCRIPTAIGLTSLAVSDLLLQGWAHALVHAVWHCLAFALPPLLFAAVSTNDGACEVGNNNEARTTNTDATRKKDN